MLRFRFFYIEKMIVQNFQLFNFFPKKIIISGIFFRPKIIIRKYFSMIFFLQNENIIQPHSSVMPAAVAHRVVDSWKALRTGNFLKKSPKSPKIIKKNNFFMCSTTARPVISQSLGQKFTDFTAFERIDRVVPILCYLVRVVFRYPYT